MWAKHKKCAEPAKVLCVTRYPPGRVKDYLPPSKLILWGVTVQHADAQVPAPSLTCCVPVGAS